MAYSSGAAPVDMTDSAYLADFTTTMTVLPYKWVTFLSLLSHS